MKRTAFFFIKLKFISVHDLYLCHGHLSCLYIKRIRESDLSSSTPIA